MRPILGSYLMVGANVCAILGVIITYTIAVCLGHAEPMWSYISYTGNSPPESCIFSMVFNSTAGVYVFIVILRYLQVNNTLEQTLLSNTVSKRMSILNIVSVTFGVLGAFGLSIAGSFQQKHFYVLHLTGVFLVCNFTFVFFLLQTYFSFSLEARITLGFIKILRSVIVALTFWILLSGAAIALYGLISYKKSFEFISVTSVPPYSPFHKLTTSMEWILFFLNQIFIFTLWTNLKNVAVKTNEIVFL